MGEGEGAAGLGAAGCGGLGGGWEGPPLLGRGPEDGATVRTPW